MQLIADRFIQEDDGRVIDAATLEGVRLVINRAGDAIAQTRWAARCDALGALRHRALAPLSDFGGIGPTMQFEAWRCASWKGSPDEALRARTRAAHFLCSIGLTTSGDADGVVASAATPVLLPAATTGYPCNADVHAAALLSVGDYGVTAIPRRASAILAEMFKHVSGPRPHAAALFGPPGSGRRTVVRDLARAARASGFVPMDAMLIGGRYDCLFRERSLFIIADGRREDGWSALLQAVGVASQPHVLLIVSDEEVDGIDNVALERVSVDALCAAVVPRRRDAALQARIRRAAEEACGLPGRFVRQFWPAVDRSAVGHRQRGRSMRMPVRVAESPVEYGGDSAQPAAGAAPAPGGVWPAPGELATLRRRMQAAIRQLGDGRHAPGIRQLRQAIGGLARRDAWIDAGEGTLVLASALLRRGRVREAHAALDDARRYGVRTGRNAMHVDAAVLGGETWIDRARLDEAEGTLAAAARAARACGDPIRSARAALALARCLFWRGRFADAAAALPPTGDELTTALSVRCGSLAARIAVGERDLPRAIRLAAQALEWAGRAGSPELHAGAAGAAAFVHLAAGDHQAVDRHVTTAVAAARTARDPLRAVRARLLLAEADRRRGRGTQAARYLARIASRDHAVPPLVAARTALLRDLLAAREADHAIVRRHVAATGLAALTLFVPERRAPGRLSLDDPMADEIIAILQACQTAEDDGVVLREVCGRVRRQIRAQSVACIAAIGNGRETIASDGPRIEPAILERALSAGIMLAPHRCDDRIEAAVPVQYGGVTIGAVCARWTIGSTDDLSRAGMVLAMVASAVAPMVSAVIARRDRPAGGGPELLGVTAAISELRDAVERAAAAPFPVLVDGESGCGKELVARAIHRRSARRDRPFCTLNCAALPDDLVEAELFGHARGAFTGAVADRPGVFEEAHGGTLLLDEIGELSPRAQAKLLRVIQEGELRRVGENVPRRVDVRIVSATNRNLRDEVSAGRFRLDLLYRLDVVRIAVPPLRDRREDILLLVDHFWRDAAIRTGSRAVLAAATRAALARYDWPGNVRELQNVLAALAVRSPKRGAVPPTALPPQFGEARRGDGWRLGEARRTFEQGFVRAALVRAGGHRGRAAEELGVTRQGLTKLLGRLGIEG